MAKKDEGATTQLVKRATKDPEFFHKLVFSTEEAIAELDFLTREQKSRLLALNPQSVVASLISGRLDIPGLAACGDSCEGSCVATCLDDSCGSTCGSDSCINTCTSSSCSEATCLSSCGSTCGGDSCGYTTDLQMNPLELRAVRDLASRVQPGRFHFRPWTRF